MTMKPKVFDAIGLMKQESKLTPLTIAILLMLGVVLLEVMIVVPQVPAKLHADVSISESQKTQAESEVEIANLLKKDIIELQELRESSQELARELHGLRLDYEWQSKPKHRKQLPSPTALTW